MFCRISAFSVRMALPKCCFGKQTARQPRGYQLRDNKTNNRRSSYDRRSLGSPGLRQFGLRYPKASKRTRLSLHAHAQLLARRTISTDSAKSSLAGVQHLRDPGSTTKRAFITILTALIVTFGYFYLTDTRASFHSWIIVPVMRVLYPDAEEAHEAGVAILKNLYRLGLHPRERGLEDDPEIFKVQVFGHTLRSPVAISAGLDKHAEVVSPLFALGPSIVEIGGVTPLPQDGNVKPRVWRIPSQQALINRYGLNSRGAVHVTSQLRQRVRKFAYAHGYGIDQEAENRVLNGGAGVPPGSLIPGSLLAVQIAKNKTTSEQDHEAVTRDYVECVQQLAPLADIIVVNVSSPNTPGLRSLQQTQPLKKILTGVVQATKAISRRTKPAVMVKVSPDETSEEDIQGICNAVWESDVDGVIVANTTRRRPLTSSSAKLLTGRESMILYKQGGYSGPALLDGTLDLVKRYRQALDTPLRTRLDDDDDRRKRKVIFASGGIYSGEDVIRARDAGASIAMVYTAMVYEGSGLITTLKRQMRQIMKQSTVIPSYA